MPVRWVPRLVLGGLLVTGTACGGTAGPTDGGGTSDPTDDTRTSSTVQDPPAPRGQPLIEGLPAITALGPPEGGAGEAPLFSWGPVPGASRYSLAVLGPEGPLWAWQGEETEVYLGGLPFERPPGWAGPVIVAGSCWSVVALDAAGHVVAASEFLPVSPADAPGHECVPGEGFEPGG
jgi:hypothetical protein